MNCTHPFSLGRLAMGLAIIVMGLASGPVRAGEVVMESPAFLPRLEAFRTLVIDTFPYDPKNPINNHRSQVLNAIDETERLFRAGDYEAARTKLGQMRNLSSEKALRTEAGDLQGLFEVQVRDIVQGILVQCEAALARLPTVCTGSPETLADVQARIGAAQDEVSRIRSTTYAGNRLAQLRDRVTSAQGLLHAIATVESQRIAGQHGEALRHLSRIGDNAAWKLLVAPDCLESLREKLRVSVEQAIDAKSAEVARMLERAEGPSAVQALSRELQPFMEQYANLREGDYQVRLDRLRQSVALWLAVLTAEAAGDYKGALRALQQEFKSPMIGILPTALVEAKRTALQLRVMAAPRAPDPAIIAQVDAAMREAESIADLLPLVPRLRALLEASPGDDLVELNALLTDIQALSADVVNAPRYRSSLPLVTHRWRARIARMADEHMVRMIAAVTLLDELHFTTASETAAELLLREANQAAHEGEWERLLALLSAYRQYIIPANATPEWLEADLAGVRLFLAARRFEAAGADEDAMAAYRATVQTIGPRVPHEAAAQRLAELVRLSAKK